MSPAEPGRPKLLFLVTEDWYFWSHRLPVARAARDAGFAVVVATRVTAHAAAIEAEGFVLRPLAWRRRGDGVVGACRAIAAIARLYRAERPDIVHHVALKAVAFGGLALRLAFPRRRTRPAPIDAVMGLGSQLSTTHLPGRLRRLCFGVVLRRLAAQVIVQNPEDGVALTRLGVAKERIALIRGSGVDTAYFAPLAEPEGGDIVVALVGRMLRDKGVLEAAAAIRRLRHERATITLLLAGAADPDNPGSLDDAALTALCSEPGVQWLGRVADIRTVWRRAAIAVLPTSYGEGLPKALLEAAACARPIITTDMPGCREIVRHGETGLLVPVRDVAALAEALAALAADPARRRAMGLAARALVERDFADAIVARQTLALYRGVLRPPGREPASRR